MGAYPTALAASGVDRTSPDSLAAFDSERDLLRLAQRRRLARERDTWTRELAGREAAAARPRLREEAILAFQQHVAAEHGDMEAWASHFMRELLLIVRARVEVWPQRDVQSGAAQDRAVLHVDLPLAGERAALHSRSCCVMSMC
jgi:hypothetical protein